MSTSVFNIKLEFFDLIGLFVKSRASHVNTKKKGTKGGEEEINCNLKFKIKKKFSTRHLIII